MELAHFGDLFQDAEGDPDRDYLTNFEEFQNGTDPTLADTDGDGLSDLEEVYGYSFYGYSYMKPIPPNGTPIMTDLATVMKSSTITLILQILIQTTTAWTTGKKSKFTAPIRQLPTAITTALGMLRINIHGTNPILRDTDDDGLSDGDEILIYGTDPLVHDSDLDGMSDGWEITHGFDPHDPADADGDPDDDKLTNR